MSVKSGQAVTVDFTTADPTTGAAANATSLPTATLVVNGTDNAATVTVTNKTTGVYKAAVTLPTLAAGDVVSLRVAATVATVAGVGVVWTDVTDTKRVSDLKDEAMRGTDGALTDKTGFALTSDYDAAKAAASQTSVNALPTDADVQAAAQAAIVAQDVATATALAAVDTVVDGIAADYAKMGEAATAVASLGYVAPNNAAIAAAAASAASADGKLTAERLAKLDGAAQEATVEAIPTAAQNADAVDVVLSATHGAGSWEGSTPTTGALVTPLSVGDDGLPLGRIMPYGTISVYLGAELHYRFDEIADADGDFVLTLPYGSTWTLVAENPPNYRSTTAVITIPPLP